MHYCFQWLCMKNYNLEVMWVSYRLYLGKIEKEWFISYDEFFFLFLLLSLTMQLATVQFVQRLRCLIERLVQTSKQMNQKFYIFNCFTGVQLQLMHSCFYLISYHRL